MSLSDLILEALDALGGCGSIQEVEKWIISNRGGEWAHSSYGTRMADMVPVSHGGNTSSTVPSEKQVLERISTGRYCINYVKWNIRTASPSANSS